MAVLTSSVELPLPPEEVWEAVIDLDGCSQWLVFKENVLERFRARVTRGAAPAAPS